MQSLRFRISRNLSIATELLTGSTLLSLIFSVFRDTKRQQLR